MTPENHPPDRRKNDEWKTYLESRLRRFFIGVLIVLAVIGLTSAGSLLGFGVLLQRQNDTADDIQQQRFDSLVMSCLEQNARHSATIDRAQEALPLESRATVVLLVDQLQPFVKDCDKQARSRVKGTK